MELGADPGARSSEPDLCWEQQKEASHSLVQGGCNSAPPHHKEGMNCVSTAGAAACLRAHSTPHATRGCPLLSRCTPSSPAAALLGAVAGRASHGALSSSGLPAAEEPKCSCSLAEETRADSISVREKSFSPLLGSSETEIIHWVLAPTSPVIQRLTLPCIFSSITLFSGCYNLAAYMFVLLN